MRVVGFGWKEFAINWSCKGKKWSVRELADHLQKIMKAEKCKDIPSNPALDIPKQTYQNR